MTTQNIQNYILLQPFQNNVSLKQISGDIPSQDVHGQTQIYQPIQNYYIPTRYISLIKQGQIYCVPVPVSYIQTSTPVYQSIQNNYIPRYTFSNKQSPSYSVPIYSQVKQVQHNINDMPVTVPLQKTPALPISVPFPNLKQEDEYSCAPVSAANSIIWLSNNGYKNLYTSNNPSTLIEELSKHVKLIKEVNKGTTANNMCVGLENFINSRGYKISKLEYQGIRPVDDKYKTSMCPDIEKIKKEIKKGNVVLLNLGIYNKKNSQYERHYGHWITVTGTGQNDSLSDDKSLAIHDPYSKSNGNFYIKPAKIESGKFFHNYDDNEKTLTDDASGFYEIPEKFNYLENDEIAVIDGAVILEMDKNSKQ
ncbi:MAG: C39 family peptidase [bacterium]